MLGSKSFGKGVYFNIHDRRQNLAANDADAQKTDEIALRILRLWLGARKFEKGVYFNIHDRPRIFQSNEARTQKTKSKMPG